MTPIYAHTITHIIIIIIIIIHESSPFWVNRLCLSTMPAQTWSVELSCWRAGCSSTGPK
jgi:hypothetical protein